MTNAMIIGRVQRGESIRLRGATSAWGHSPPMHSAPVCGAAGGNDLEFIVAGSDFRLNGVRLGASLAGNLSSELISITGIAPGSKLP